MAGTLSGGISFQGLGSGTDFTTMIEKLKSFEQLPMKRMQVWREEWNVRIDAFNDIMDTMKEARTALRSFSSLDSMLARGVSSSKDTVATAKANSKIEEGVYSIDVKQLATSAIFSSKKVFTSKDMKINESGTDESFTYTYKGTTRNIEVSSGTTLQQFADKINKDPSNPGVKASLIKSGAGYVMQIQGKETGAASSLSIESTMPDFDATPHFSGRDFVVNQTGADEDYTFTHKGKEFTINVKNGMTADAFVNEINKLSSSSGVTASLVQDGSDYKLQWKDTTIKLPLDVPSRTNLASLGAQKSFNPNDVINNTGSVQTYKYSHDGQEYTLNVSAGTTMQGLVDQINASASSSGGLTARFDTGTGRIAFDSTLKYLSSNDGNPMRFSFTRAGYTGGASMDIPDGMSLDAFAAQFNASAISKAYTDDTDLSDPTKNFSGLTAYVDTNNVLKFKNSKTNTDLTAGELAAMGITTNVPGLGDGQPVTASTRTDVKMGISTTLEGLGGIPKFSGKDLIVNDATTPQSYSITSNGQTLSFDVPPGTTMEDFSALFNQKVADHNTANPSAQIDLKMSLKATGSGYELATTTLDGTTSAKPDTVTTGMNRLRGAQDNWHTAQATDAIFKLNGWDQELTSGSNTLKEVVEGLDITLKGKGETSLTVTNDSEKLMENIEEVVGAINSMRIKIAELSKVDSEKEKKEPEVDDSTGLLKMASQFTWQMGSATTGNYGVQMLKSRLNNLTATKGQGYVNRQNEDDVLNDLFTALSQIGISTITKESDPEFGLLSIDKDKLKEAMDQDFRGVAELFSAKKQGSTDSADFSIASVGTKAKAGVYDVTYDIDPTTKQAVNVTINGVAAATDSAYPGRWTVADLSNPAAGLAIQFTEAELNGGPGRQKGSVRVKDGKVNEMLETLDAELQPVVQDSAHKTGALPLLVSNYGDIIKGIDKKIARETDRIAMWEKRQKAKFSRLDTLLAQYSQKMEAGAAALGSLSSGSK